VVEKDGVVGFDEEGVVGCEGRVDRGGRGEGCAVVVRSRGGGGGADGRLRARDVRVAARGLLGSKRGSVHLRTGVDERDDQHRKE
jgi:hypothetical protein